MSRKIARITQDKKLLLANEAVESNAKTSLNSDGRLEVDEIIEYPAELEGGRNLALIRDYSHDNQYQTVTKTGETFNGQPVYRAIKKTTGTPPTSIGDITIRKGETFTASIWIKHEQQPTIRASQLMFYKNVSLKSVLAKDNYGEWERLIVTYTNDTNADIENVSIYFYPANGVGCVTYFTCPKIERGNKATDWTPAPEDLGLNYPDSIQNFNSSISGNNIIVPEFIEGYPFVKPVIDDSLILWLDGSTGNNYEQTGTWKDLSGNGNDGQLMNFGYIEDSGWGDGGLKFDGVDDYVRVPNVLNTDGDFTVEIWAESDVYNTARALFNTNTRASSPWNDKGFYITNIFNPQYLYCYINDGINERLNLAINYVSTFNNSHIVVKREGNMMYSFFNYTRQNSLNISSYESFKTDNDITIARGYKGKVKVVRIYDRALSNEEILQNYQAGQCSPLLAMRGDV